jgi:nucleoside-diphosphate-sugar epimerase
LRCCAGGAAGRPAALPLGLAAMTVEPPQPVVALFGAAGFVGRAMVSALLDAGYAVRALDLSEESWFSHTAHGRVRAERGLPHHPRAHDHLELLYGDISDQVVVEKVMRGCCACVHTTVFFPQQVGRPGQHAGVTFADAGSTADQTWLVNLKGLWNVLDAATRFGLRRIVHVGSAPTVHPGSSEHTPGTVKMTADVRRPDGSLYAIQKRMQEEMCRGFYGMGVPSWCLRAPICPHPTTPLLIATVAGQRRAERGSSACAPMPSWTCAPGPTVAAR